MKIDDVNIQKLARLFAKYDFFCDYKTKEEYEAYYYLSDVYDCMTQFGKEKLLIYYQIEKDREKKKATQG